MTVNSLVIPFHVGFLIRSDLKQTVGMIMYEAKNILVRFATANKESRAKLCGESLGCLQLQCTGVRAAHLPSPIIHETSLLGLFSLFPLISTATYTLESEVA